jgi:hypothetical protein
MKLLMDHGVIGHVVLEPLLLGGCGQFAGEQQVADLQIVAVLRQLLDPVAPVQQHAGLAVDEGDLGFAAAGRGIAGVVGEQTGLGVKVTDIGDAGPLGSVQQRKLPGLARGILGHGDAILHLRLGHAIPPCL